MTAETWKTGTGGSPSIRDFYRFKQLPGAYCHPDQIRALLPDGLPSSLRDRLLQSKRLRPRLSCLLSDRFALEACSKDDLKSPISRFAMREGEALREAILGIGAIHHGQTLRRIILAEQLRQLIGHIGRGNYQRALASIDLAADQLDEPKDIDGNLDIQALTVLIERDGLLAIKAWCPHQPEALAKRLLLKLPPGDHDPGKPAARHLEQSLLIVDRVAFALMDQSPSSELGL